MDFPAYLALDFIACVLAGVCLCACMCVCTCAFMRMCVFIHIKDSRLLYYLIKEIKNMAS